MNFRFKINSQILIKGVIQNLSLGHIISGNRLFRLRKANNDLWTVVFVDVKMRRLWNFGERKVFWEGLEVLALEKHFIFGIFICTSFFILFFHVRVLKKRSDSSRIYR